MVESVYSAVRTDSLYKKVYALPLKGWNEMEINITSAVLVSSNNIEDTVVIYMHTIYLNFQEICIFPTLFIFI